VSPEREATGLPLAGYFVVYGFIGLYFPCAVCFRLQYTFSVVSICLHGHVTGSSVFVNESAIEDDPKLGATDRQRDSCEVPTPETSVV